MALTGSSRVDAPELQRPGREVSLYPGSRGGSSSTVRRVPGRGIPGTQPGRCHRPHPRRRNPGRCRPRAPRRSVDGQLALGAEHQARRQLHDPPLHGVVEVLARDPLPGRDQRVPGALAGIGQMDRGNPVGHLPGAAQIVTLHAGRALTLLDLAGLIDRADRQGAAAKAAGGLVQPGDGEPPHHPHRRTGVPDSAAEQPLHPIRSPVPGPLGQRPAVTSGQVAHQRGGVLARLQPRFYPGETRAQQFQQLSAFPPAEPGAYPGGSSRLRFCYPHKRMIARRLRCAKAYATLSSRSQAEWLLPY